MTGYEGQLTCWGFVSTYILSTHQETKCILSFGAGCTLETIGKKFCNHERDLNEDEYTLKKNRKQVLII